MAKGFKAHCSFAFEGRTKWEESQLNQQNRYQVDVAFSDNILKRLFTTHKKT
jgi:hypothetical protein